MKSWMGELKKLCEEKAEPVKLASYELVKPVLIFSLAPISEI